MSMPSIATQHKKPYEPLIKAKQSWNSGRHWAVAYKCTRCSTVEFKLYDPSEGHEGNLQCVNPPEDWSIFGFGMSQLLCPECTKSFKEWMNK